MLETDIIVRGYGTSNQTDVPINAHPPATDSDITVQEWIKCISKHPNKGIKLDFKCIEALESTLLILQQSKSKIQVPVLLNADIAVGPGSSRSPVDAASFLQMCNKHFPSAIMSLGWTTGWKAGINTTYTWEMITDLLYEVLKLTQPVTFPVRAVYLSTSWRCFLYVLGLKSSFSVTVWSSARDDVDMMGLVKLRKFAGKGRVYFDLPKSQMEQFEKVLQTDDDSITGKEYHSDWNREDWYLDDSESVPENGVYLSTTGVLFLSRNSRHSTSQRVHSKQMFEVTETEKQPLKISGKLQFTDTNNVGESTKFYVYISCSSESVQVDSSSDVLAMSISRRGEVEWQNITSSVTATDSTLPISSTYQFTLCNIGIGLKPVLNVNPSDCEHSKSQHSDLSHSVQLAMRENFAVQCSGSTKLRVSFCKGGTTNDLLLEDFVVSS